jgi:beta-RFAP synthase
MYRVHAPSRLHFGLLRLPGTDAVRSFGGVGLMIQQPGLTVAAELAGAWSAEGPLAERALDFARHFARSFAPQDERPCHISIERAAPEHAGLGTGTQLGLAVARALALLWGRGDIEAPELASHIGRGKRSALGIHGFQRGGFLVDGGRGPHTTIAPLIARLEFPEDWRIVLVRRHGSQGLHGVAETQAFERLEAHEQRTERLCRLVLLGILPALAERDLLAFAEAIYEFNSQVGDMFRTLQDGRYANASARAFVDFIRRQGIAGVGQSSWGPTIFAVVDRDRAGSLALKVRKEFGLLDEELLVCEAANQGAHIDSRTQPS